MKELAQLSTMGHTQVQQGIALLNGDGHPLLVTGVVSHCSHYQSLQRMACNVGVQPSANGHLLTHRNPLFCCARAHAICYEHCMSVFYLAPTQYVRAPARCSSFIFVLSRMKPVVWSLQDESVLDVLDLDRCVGGVRKRGQLRSRVGCC